MNKLICGIVGLILLTSTTLFAQQTGTVTGRVTDEKSGKPVEFATVALFTPTDQPVKAGQTDLDGKFTLSGLADGNYILRITFVSYANLNKEGINISAAKKNYNLGVLKLSPVNSVLKEVVVSAPKSTIQLGVDKKVFNVDQSLVSQGGSATDLLSNVPSVQVDVDGNVNLRGSSNVRVLINGKPSALTGASITDILQSIPASQIENIEVITNPSSKYDPEGQSGIINIVLKKNARVGFNGLASATVGSQQTYNGNLSLGYQTPKYNLYANYSYRHGKRTGNGYSDRQTYFGSDTLFQHQISDQSFIFNSHNVRAGFDYNFTDNTTLGLSSNINSRKRDRFQTGTTQQYDQSRVPTQETIQDNTSNGNGTNVDMNLDFTHKFSRPQEVLTANVGYSTESGDNYDYLKTDYNYYNPVSSTLFRQNNYTKDSEHNWNLQADYVLPFKDNKGRFEAGYRSTLNKSDNDYNVDTLTTAQLFGRDNTQSNRFLYNEYVHAVYANYQRQLGSFGVQVGLRLEDANIRTSLIDSATVTKNKQDYMRLYPSIFLSQKFGDNQTLQLSYTRRVSRPRERELSPFLDRSDPLSYRQGNPYLRPEDTHSFELSYINYWKSLTLTSSVYYRLTNQNFQRISQAIDSTRTLTTVQNINSSRNAGYELIAKMTFSRKFDVTGNANVYYSQIDGDAALGLEETSGYSWNGNITGNYKPVKKLSFQLRYDYNGPRVFAQGRMNAIKGFDAGARYDFTDKFNISVNARDVFNQRKFAFETNNTVGPYAYDQYSQRRFQTRVVTFNLSYRFGSTSRKDNKGDRKNDGDSQGGGNQMPDDGMK